MKFLRRTAHVVSMMAPLSLLAYAVLAQTPQQPRSRPDDTAPVTRQDYERDKRVTADALKAIRDDIAKRESNTRPQNLNEWKFGDKAPVWSNWFLFGAAIAAAFAALWTLRSINRQTRAVRHQTLATLRSVKQADRHFRLANQQWIDFSEWDGDVEVFKATTTQPERGFLVITFICTNQSDSPLTIKTIEFFISGAPGKRTSLSIGLPIGPRGRYRPTPGIGHLLGDDQFRTYRTNGFWTSIVGKIHYIDALGEDQTQSFGRLCVARDGSPTELPELTANYQATWDRCVELEREEVNRQDSQEPS